MTHDGSLTPGYGAIATAVAAIIVYALALGNGFAFDDVVLIPGDARVTGSQLGTLLTTPYWKDSALALYRPLTSLTFGLDWYLADGNAPWFHFVNVLWHALASVLAYRLLLRFFAPAAALIGGLAFALHPVHVEAVANVVGRAELIAATFFLAGCLAWSSRTLGTGGRAALASLCYALAMFAKEGAVVLPAVLLLMDFALGNGGADYLRRRWREYGALIVAFAAFMIVRWSVLGGIAPSRVDPTLEIATTLPHRLLTALQAWPIQAKLLFFPVTLLADYGPRILMPIQEFTPLATLGLTLIVATVLGGMVALLRGKYLWALGLLWFPITILPVSNLLFPIGVLVAERTLYVPSLVVSLAAAAVAAHARTLAHSHTRTLVFAGLAIAIGFTARTVTRIPKWDSTDSILTALVADRPDAFRGQWHMARMARARADTVGALQRYDAVLRIWPYRESLVEDAAAYGTAHGRAAWARDVAYWGTRRWPHNVNFHRMYAGNAIDMGDTATARTAVTKGLTLAPDDSVLIQMWRAFGQPRTEP